MANEGSTKPTYSDMPKQAEEVPRVERDWRTMGLVEIAAENSSVADYVEHWEGRTEKAESELARVRGLLQRAKELLRKSINTTSFFDEDVEKQILEFLSQGAESADIGKLDSAPEKAMKAIYALREEMLNYSPSGAKSGVEMGKVNRVEEMCADCLDLCATCSRRFKEPPVHGCAGCSFKCCGFCSAGSAGTGGEKA